MKKNPLPHSMNFKRWRSMLSILFLGVLVLAFSPMFLGPGLTGTEPIGGFLNGNFPDVDLSDEPYEEAYGSVRFDWPLTFTP
ncbi:hypothetical protein, partial [Maribacter sp. 4G9]|uniref:hypothetical protein n=1 Tax=Maribacter sp. 4G9 TaxID=1889777 RepID=UPI0010564634